MKFRAGWTYCSHFIARVNQQYNTTSQSVIVQSSVVHWTELIDHHTTNKVRIDHHTTNKVTKW